GPSTWAVGLRVTDARGLSGQAVVSITVTNVAPTADVWDGGPIEQGMAVDVGFSNPFDPSPADTAAGFRYSYDWNNHGDFTDPGDFENVPDAMESGPQFTHPGAYDIHLRITDKDGGFTDYITTVDVEYKPPAIFATGAASGMAPVVNVFEQPFGMTSWQGRD